MILRMHTTVFKQCVVLLQCCLITATVYAFKVNNASYLLARYEHLFAYPVAVLYGSRIVLGKKNILSGGRHLLCGGRHLIYLAAAT